MAQVDVTEMNFDPAMPPNSLIGLEYHLIGIKEEPVMRSFFCMLRTERVRRLNAGEKKIMVDFLFRAAYEKLLRKESLQCSGCGALISLEEFGNDPFKLACDDSESCKKSMIEKDLIRKKDALVSELMGCICGAKKMMLETANQHSSSNHPAESSINHIDRIPEKRCADLKKLLSQYEEAIKMNRNDTYGICIDCFEEIDPGRLFATPNANRCTGCKTAVEEAGKVHGKNGAMVPLNRLDINRGRV
jgi:RNA polymerase-binding transcription factor DksA